MGMKRTFIFVCLLCVSSLHAEAATKRSNHTKTEFKRHWKCPSTGLYGGKCPGFIMDHKIPLYCGGLDKWENLQWQSVEESKAKDRWEIKDCSVWRMK